MTVPRQQHNNRKRKRQVANALPERASRSATRTGLPCGAPAEAPSDRSPAAGKSLFQRPWLAAALVIGAGVLAYSNSFCGVFVFDDRLEIVKNPALARLWPPGGAMFGGQTMPARPLPYYTFAINYALHGTKVWGYHAVNLAIHLAAGLVLFGIVRRTLRMPRVPSRYAAAADGLALAAALLWVVHPLQTESVTYIYQRMESLMGLFYLLTLYCFLRSAASPRPWLWLEAAVLCCAAGMDSKEVMVTAPLLVLWYDRVFVARGWGDLFRRRWGFYAALAATWIIVLAVMGCQAHLYRETDAASMPCAPWRYALNQPIVILHYLRLTFFPCGLCLHYHWPGAATFAEMVVPGLALLALLAATAWCTVRRPAWGFVAGSFFLALSVTSSVIPVFDMIFEHRMYLSLAAVAVLVVLGAFDVLNVLLPLPVGFSRQRWLHALPVALAVAALAATTYDRNFAYAGLVDMWQDVAVKCPRNEIAQKCLGIGFVEQHRYEESIVAFRRALALADALPVAPAPAWLAEVHTNLGASLVNTGRLAEAMRSYEEAVRIDPAYAGAYLNMGTLFGRLGDLARARQCFEKAIALRPEYAPSYYNLGVLLESTDGEAACRCYQTALSLDPDYAPAHNLLGMSLLRHGDRAQAIEHFRRALRSDADLALARRNLALACQPPAADDGADRSK
jgi:Flp pilus assembly protein TadD